MTPIRAFVLSLLLTAPLAARAADLVVWWEEGWYPEEDRAVTELVAAFEAETGTDVELVRQPHSAEALVQAALEAGRPPDFLWELGDATELVEQWPTRIGLWTSPGARASAGGVRP